MPKFAANLTTMFQEMPFEARFAAASEAGFKAVEILAPYAWDIDALNALLANHDLKLLLINISPGAPGQTGTAALPGSQQDFQDSFSEALRYASATGAGMIHVLAGRSDASVRADTQVFVENLQWAATEAAGANIQLLLEPLNNRDVPGYLHSYLADTAALISEIDRDNVKLQFDFYHQQIMEGNLTDNIARYLGMIGHVQFSSVPGRHEPQYGEVNVGFLCEYLDDLGYTGWIGCEYVAKHGTSEGLSWGAPFGIGG